MIEHSQIHRGQHNAENRSNLEGILKDLSENQGGEGWHKCPYCAYQLGYKHGRAQTIKKLTESK